mgnify:FL=1
MTTSKKSNNKTAIRKLSEAEISYLQEAKFYDKVVDLTALISINQHDIDTDGRGIRASGIFTRQTLTAFSLKKIMPRPSSNSHHESTLWDISTIASLARNLLEGYLAIYYFGIESVSSEEAELRFFLLQLHRNVEWYEIIKGSNPQDPSLEEYEEGIPKQKARVKEHSFLKILTDAQKSKALRGNEMYKTKADFERDVSICRNLRRDYRYLSNLVHPLPFSIERIDFNKGRGIGSDADVSHCLMCLTIARVYLAASTIGFSDHFPNSLANKYKNEIDEARPLMKWEVSA